MRNIDHLTTFLTGLGIGVAASVLLAPRSGSQTQTRIRELAARAGDALSLRAREFGTAAGGAVKDCKLTMQEQKDAADRKACELKAKAQSKIDLATEAARTTATQIVDKSRDLAHTSGRKLEVGAKVLQEA